MSGIPSEKAKERTTLELVPSTRQEQILAPQFRACLRVLQMDYPSLVEEVRHEVEVNPVLEVEAPEAISTISDELRHRENESEGESSTSMMEDESNPSVSIDEDAAERRQRFFDRQVVTESLQDHLLAQVGAAGFDESDRQLAELLVGDVNEDGRYVGSFADLSSVTGFSRKKLEAVLARVQTFDPPGVAARNLRECLEIQARQKEMGPALRQLVLDIIENHLTDVARQGLDELARRLSVSKEICQTAVEVLRSLEPKPGRPFLGNGRHPQFICPELDVECSPRGMTLTSCENNLPTLTINPLYRNMAANRQTPRETRRYLREHIGKAELLQEAIHRRGETILKVAEAVFAEQHEFFEKGFEALRPLTIEEIARRTGYHGTTVGRAVSGKYVRTPRGVFELRQFFCVGRVGASGRADVSAVAVKCRLSRLVREEGSKTLTDELLAQMLGKEGLEISRRTVAKYRSELNIPSAAERRRRNVL